MEPVGGLEHDDEVAVGEAAEGGVGLEDARGSVHEEYVVVHDLQGRRSGKGADFLAQRLTFIIYESFFNIPDKGAKAYVKQALTSKGHSHFGPRQ